MLKKRIITSAIILLACLYPAMHVEAGDINGAEQSVISYASNTFSYNGKLYRATSGAVGQLRAELAADGVDLTQSQAQDAIRQIRANVKAGIEEGYLVEVQSEPDPTNTPEPTATSQPQDGQNAATEQPQQTENAQTGADNTDEQQDKDPENLDNNIIVIDDETKETDTDDKEPDISTLEPEQSVDVDEYIEKADDEYVDIDTSDSEDKDSVISVKEHIDGDMTVLNQDGDLLLKGNLPVKNTGLYVNIYKTIIMVILAIAGTIGSCIIVRKWKKSIYVVVPVLSGIFLCLGIVLGCGDIWNNSLSQWKSAWISGAPVYEYSNRIQNAELPTEGTILKTDIQYPESGEQYGELNWKEGTLQVPVYYGDTDAVFEQGAGTYTGYSLPGQGKTILIGGHDGTFFTPLADMKKGDIINLTTTYGKYEYKITDIRIADIKEADAYQEKETETLILYTCYPFGQESEVRTERYYVYAEKISGPDIGADEKE